MNEQVNLFPKNLAMPATSNGTFMLNKLMELQFFPTNGVLYLLMHNMSARVTQHYSDIEDQTQAPCVMPPLKVLQIFPMQNKSLLNVNGGVDPSKYSLIKFDIDAPCFRLSLKVNFHIMMCIFHKDIYCTLVDEGYSTCVMFVSCWKDIVFRAFSKSSTTL